MALHEAAELTALNCHNSGVVTPELEGIKLPSVAVPSGVLPLKPYPIKPENSPHWRMGSREHL